MEYHARTLTGLEDVLAQEVETLGGQSIEVRNRLVIFHADLRVLYRLHLACRTAIRILEPLARFAASSEKQLYDAVQNLDWRQYMDTEATLAVDPIVRSSFCTHSLYAAQLVKDAIVDQMRTVDGKRPGVDLENPDLRVGLYLNQNQAILYRDASGDSLHKRGYRKQTGKAPLSEVLAAGILKLAGWTGETNLIDPMCGAGTLVIEAALLASNYAPGLLRSGFAFQRWPDFDASIFKEEIDSALDQIQTPAVEIVGSDKDRSALDHAEQNAAAAGMEAFVRFEHLAAHQVVAPSQSTVVLNPPYDERLSLKKADKFYQDLGDTLKHRYAGCTAHILTANLDAAKKIGLKPSKRTVLYNGSLECRLLQFELYQSKGTRPGWRDPSGRPPIAGKWKQQAEMFENRLRKMAKHWSKWARRQDIRCFRLYDRDIPDVPLVLDWYDGQLHCAEVVRPHDRTPKEHDLWLETMIRLAAVVLELDEEDVFFKQRQRQRGKSQYTRQQESGQLRFVEEAGLKFYVNLEDYLDTGLFLDHRQTRAMVREQAEGKRFLNLFAYTGAFTVYAAAGKAAFTTSVDTSNTYLDWARKNLNANGFTGGRHQFVRQDVMQFLTQNRGARKFDLVVVDPPTFSNSKRTTEIFDVQRDHVPLLEAVLDNVVDGGSVYFSTNRRKFQFAESEIDASKIIDITAQTVPPDFQRKRPHRCWLLVK